MLTILEQSVSDNRLRSFRTHKWKSSNNLMNTSTETFWSVRTQFRKHRFIQYVKLKVLMGRASLFEQRLCYDAPGVLKDNLFIEALRAWRTDVPRSILWQRLQWLQELEARPIWSENLYHTYDNCVCYEIEEIRISIRKVKKYSGYVRNSSSVGSKRFSVTTRPEPESFEWNTNEELDYYQFLTVGEFSSGQPGTVIVTLNERPKGRNGKTPKTHS